MRRLKIIIPLAAVAALVLAGCAPSSSTPAASIASTPLSTQQSSLYETAKSEPSLTWYSSQDPDRNDAVTAAFQARYPDAHVTSFRLASGALANRYSQEKQSNVNTAGLVTLASPEFVQQGLASGWFEPATPEMFPELSQFPTQFFADGVVTVGVSVFGIGYNTTLVTSPPKDWKDLLDPSYQGKIIFGDPRNVPAYIALAKVWDDEYGDDFFTKLKAQNLTVVDSMVPGVQQVAAGEGAVGLPSVLTVLNPLKVKGAPLQMVVPDVTTGNEFQDLIPKDGPSPATAKLLYDFLLTPEGQAAFNGTTSASPISAPGTAALPSDYRSVSLAAITANRDKILGLLGIQ